MIFFQFYRQIFEVFFRIFNNSLKKHKKGRKHRKSRPRARDSSEKNALEESVTNTETPPPNYSAVASISHSVVSSDIHSGRSSLSTSSRESVTATSVNNYSDTSQDRKFYKK